MSDSKEATSLGVDPLDAHHRHLRRRIRRLEEAVRAGDAREARTSLRLLGTYLAEHDPDEERWMEEAGYPAAREHVRAHAAVRERIAAARADEGAGSEPRVLEAGGEVARSLAAHLASDDVRLARFWTARQNLRRLAEEGPGVGAALTPIPGILPAFVTRPRREEEQAPTPAPLPPADG